MNQTNFFYSPRLAGARRFFAIAGFLGITGSAVFAACGICSAQETRPPVGLNAAVHKEAPFLKHTGAGAFDNYLSMNLPFEPINALRETLQKRTGVVLKARSEAHITVITPPEYSKILSKALSMDEINGIAERSNIQKARFTAVCVGRAQASLDGVTEQTYYVVARSEDLLALRRSIFRRYVEKGGEPSLFDPNHFYPHITVGFTKQDLHEEGQGVKKGENSCFLPIVEE